MGFMNDNSLGDEVAKRFNNSNKKTKDERTTEELKKANKPLKGTDVPTAGRAAQGHAGSRSTLHNQQRGASSPQRGSGKGKR